jgi:ribosomal protein L11 methyltransferase
VPYRIDIERIDESGLLRLLDLGAIDIESSREGPGAAVLMPDAVSPQDVAEVLGLARVSVSAVTGRDADSVWMLSHQPVRIGRLRFVPATRADVVPAPGVLRMLDTAAFGTGRHPTTALCVEVIDDLVSTTPPTSMLDVGTGSGVLALAALAHGVPHVVAIDIDGEAVRTAVAHARLNGLATRLHAVHADLTALRGRWPLVVANVLAAPLVEMAPRLTACVGHGGELVLSGIPSAVSEDVARAYRHLGMHLVDVRTRAGWVALVLRASW